MGLEVRAGAESRCAGLRRSREITEDLPLSYIALENVSVRGMGQYMGVAMVCVQHRIAQRCESSWRDSHPCTFGVAVGVWVTLPRFASWCL